MAKFVYMPLLAIVLASSIAATAAPLELVAALMHDAHVNGCAKSAGKPARAYVAQAFDLRNVTLRTGERMTVAVATDFCLMLGQSTRIFIYERTAGGYRRVLDDVTMPSAANVSSDGTVMLPTHESMDVIFEATYVWNGTTYAFSGPQSHRYDVALGQRRPYEVQVRFAPGTWATTLSGSVAYNFGDGYVFEARAGQRLTIELTGHTGRHPFISLYYGSETSSLAELFDTDRWSGELRKTGAYHLFISGKSESDETRLSTYALRLAIR
jgi:hypothetical protein